MKNIWKWIVAVLVVLLSFLGWWFWFEKGRNVDWNETPISNGHDQSGANEQKQSDDLKSDVTVDTSNWKTYRNEEYGFELKYPKEWVVFDDYPDYNQIFLSLPENEDFRVDGVMLYMGKAAILTPEEAIKSVSEGAETGSGAILSDSKILLKGNIEGRKILQERAIGDRVSYLFLENDGRRYVFRSSEFMGGNPCKSCGLVVETLEFVK